MNPLLPTIPCEIMPTKFLGCKGTEMKNLGNLPVALQPHPLRIDLVKSF